MKNKYLITTMSVIIIMLCGFVNNSKAEEPKVYKIGAIIPLTGPAAFIGEWHRQGLEIAKNKINQTANVKIDILYEDSVNDPKTGINAYNNLKFRNVDMYISAFSGVTMPLIPLIDKEKKAMFVTSVSFPGIAEKSKFLYRYNITSDEEAKMISKYLLEKLKIKEINLFYINDEYGLGARQAFIDSFEKQNGKIKFETSFEKNETDFKGSILKSKNDLPYVVAGYGKSYTVLLMQIAQLVKNPKIVTVYSMDIQEFIQPLIGSGLDVLYTRPIHSESNKEFIEFESKFEQIYKKKPNMVNILCYDLLHIIYECQKISPSLDKNQIMLQKDKIKIKSGYGYSIDILPSGEINIPLEIIGKKL